MSFDSESLDDSLLCSIATCLFAVVHLETTSDVLETISNLASSLRKRNATTPVLLALYEAANNCVKNVIQEVQIDASGQHVRVREISSTDPIGAGTKIFHDLALALLDANPSSQSSATTADSEAVRTLRARLALKIIAQKNLTDNTTRAVLDRALLQWKADETSMQVHDILDEAISTSQEIARSSE